MTPCIKSLKKAKVSYKIHQYEHDSTTSSYGEEAVTKLGLAHALVFKTLVVVCDTKEFAVGIVAVSSQLNLKAMAKALAVKKVSMADAKDVEKISGYILGGVSPLGQKKKLRTVIDASAQNNDGIFVSAGKRGLEVELAPSDLQGLLNAKFEEIGI